MFKADFAQFDTSDTAFVIRLAIFILVCILAIASVNGGALDNASGYYSFDDSTADDISGNNINGTINGATDVTGIISLGKNFSAGTDDINYGDNFNVNETNDLVSIVAWVKLTGATGYIISKGRTGEWSYEIPIVGSGELAPTQHQSSGSAYRSYTTSGGTLDDGNWHHLYIYMDETIAEVWQDGQSIGSATANTGNWNKYSSYPFSLGERSGSGSGGFVGLMDEVAVYDFKLTDAQINESYNSGAGFNPYSVSTPVVSVNLTNGAYYDHDNISVKFNATSNVNMSYSINGNAFTSLGTDINTTTQFINFSLGENNFSVKAIDGSGTSHNNLTIYIDNVVPTINDSIPATIFNYTFLGSWFSCSDTNLDYCNISINSFNKGNGTDFTLTNNGNLTYNITASDLAGNTATASGVLFVNPYQYFRFNDTSTNQYIGNYTFGGYSSVDNTTTIPLFDLGYGTHTLSFVKVGYQTTTFDVTFNNTANLNVTYQVSPALINVIIRNKDDFTIVSGENFSLDFIGATGFVTSTTTGLKSLEGLLSAGTYDLFTTSQNYTSEFNEFTFTNQEVLNITVYVALSNASSTGFVVISVIDVDGQPVSSVSVSARQWNSATSSYVSVSEGKTINDGTANLNIILDTKQYIFRAQKGNALVDSVAQVVSTTDNGKTVTLTLSAGTGAPYRYLFQDINYNTSHIFNSTTNLSTVTFEWFNTLGTDVTACVNGYRTQNGVEILLGNLNCTTSSSGEIIRNFAINTTYDLYLLKAEFLSNGEYYPVDTFRVYSEDTVFKQLANYQLHYFILIFLHIISVMTALTLQNIYIGGIGLAVSSLLAISIAPTLMTTSVALFLTFISVITIVGGSNR